MNNGIKAVIHGVVSVVLFAIPYVLSSGSPELSLTVGGILNAIYHYLVASTTA